MTDENFGFCPHCGAKLTEACAYCPECGGMIGPVAGADGTYASGGYSYQPQMPKGKARPMDSQFMICFILLVMFSLFMSLTGIMMVVNADGVVAMLNESLAAQGMTFEEFIANLGIVMTEADMVAFMKYGGAMLIIVAVPAIISTILCFMRRKHMLAVAFAAAATVLVFLIDLTGGDILGLILEVAVGVMVTYMLYKNCGDYFED